MKTVLTVLILNIIFMIINYIAFYKRRKVMNLAAAFIGLFAVVSLISNYYF